MMNGRAVRAAMLGSPRGITAPLPGKERGEVGITIAVYEYIPATRQFVTVKPRCYWPPVPLEEQGADTRVFPMVS
jgi:hypothetical protein